MKKIIISIILFINLISFGYSKEITVVIGSPAGSSTDNLIRMIGEEYEKKYSVLKLSFKLPLHIDINLYPDKYPNIAISLIFKLL